MKQHRGWHSIWGCHYMAQTGVIISPTKTMHNNKGNPWKLPYICIVWSPKMGNWMTPVKRTRKSCCSDCPGCFSDFVLEVCTFALLVKQSGEPNSCESLLASPHLKKGCSTDIYLHVYVYICYIYICIYAPAPSKSKGAIWTWGNRGKGTLIIHVGVQVHVFI